MAGKGSLSATNLAAYHHFNCDLFLYNTYHGVISEFTNSPEFSRSTGNELTKAQFRRGQDWEKCLLSWLDEQNLLLTIPSLPLRGDDLVENLSADDRNHFFVSGISFIPPQAELDSLYRKAGLQSVKFGVAKPDLVEITRTSDGVSWRVIDAKASRLVKTSHHAQIYFYTLCLKYMLHEPYFQATDTAAIWLPPVDGFDTHSPSSDDLKTVDVSLLSFPLNDFLFRRLPKVLSAPRDEVSWHYNPQCRGCPFSNDCRQRAIERGELGGLNSVSIEEAKLLRNLLSIWCRLKPKVYETQISDIEDLSLLLADGDAVNEIGGSYPITMRKARRILALPPKSSSKRFSRRALVSPVVEAARTGEIQLITRRNFTCPVKEDICVVLSLLQDPSSPATSIVAFCITIWSSPTLSGVPEVLSGDSSELIPSLAYAIESILSYQSSLSTTSSTQFYVFSSAEHSALQAHLIDAALESSHPIHEIRLCIGALAQGASLLQTTFQPVLLSGVLLDFSTKGQQKKSDLQACLERMDLPTDGTVVQLRQRIRDELKRLQCEGGQADEERRKELGRLPPVVVLQKEIEKSLALPIAGFWDLPECASILVPSELPESKCSNDEDLYEAFVSGLPLLKSLKARNKSIHAILQAMRARVSSSGRDLLVNSAKPLSANFMDICREDHLRKLFHMQQFEILAGLSELWKSRIDGCPDAPILEYNCTQQSSKGTLEHIFYLVSGTLEVAAMDKNRAFFNYILALDIDCDNSGMVQEVPVEALFDDLAVSGLVFPLNQWTKSKWTAQHPRVQQELLIADIRDIAIEDRRTKVTLQTFGEADLKFSKGKSYRISSRLVDFNIAKILTTLFELDLQRELGGKIPFLQIIVDPRSFRQDVDLTLSENLKAFQKAGSEMQSLFQELTSLDVEPASSLVLKQSQHRAAQHILSNRLSVIWGPPGTGKTHTIALSMLRYLNIHFKIKDKVGDSSRKIIFFTAMTHAAIEAVLNKLYQLIQCYRLIDEYPTEWLDNIMIQHVLKGNEHPAPTHSGSISMLYAGTIYQLYNFSKQNTFAVDCIVIDEAGQLALSSASLVLRSLAPKGRIVIAGDSEQLSPILAAQYPRLKSGPLFGSMLDSLMYFSQRSSKGLQRRPHSPAPTDSSDISLTQSTIVQLTENFRLNPDLGEFVSTIYSRAFRPQKVQARQLAIAFKEINRDIGRPFGIQADMMDAVQWFLLALSNAMLNQPQNILSPPAINGGLKSHYSLLDGNRTGLPQDLAVAHKPISLALMRLQTSSAASLEGISYEAHVKAEAAVAAALVLSIRRCMPTDDIFVATPHRVQRQAVRTALEIANLHGHVHNLVEALEEINLQENEDTKPKLPRQGTVRIDTIERLQVRRRLS